MGTLRNNSKYVQRDWVNNETPLNAKNLNNIEQGISEIKNVLADYEGDLDRAKGTQVLNTALDDNNEKQKNVATGEYSTAAGLDTQSTHKAEFVVGKYNNDNVNDALFIVGSGESDAQRENALEVTKNKLISKKPTDIESTLTVTDNATLKEDLIVEGTANLQTLSVTSAEIPGTLTVEGKSTLNDTQVSTFEATNKSTLQEVSTTKLTDTGDLTVDGETTLNDATTITGPLNVDNNVVLGSESNTNTVTINGSLTVNNPAEFEDTVSLENTLTAKDINLVTKEGKLTIPTYTPAEGETLDSNLAVNHETLNKATDELESRIEAIEFFFTDAEGNPLDEINTEEVLDKLIDIQEEIKEDNTWQTSVDTSLGEINGKLATIENTGVKNPNKLTITQNDSTLGEYDGSEALTIDIPESDGGGGTSTEIVGGWFPMEVGDTITKFKWLGVEELAYPVNEDGEQMLGFTDSIANNGAFTLYDDAMLEDGRPGSGRWYKSDLVAGGVWGGYVDGFMETYSPYEEWEFRIIGNETYGWMDYSPESVGVTSVTITSIADWAKPYLQVYKTMEVEVEKPELFYAEQEPYNSATKKPNGIYFTTDTHKIYVGEDDFSNPLVKNEDGELTPLHASNKEFQEHVDEFNSYKTQVTEDIKAVETQLDYIKNTPGVKPLPDSSNDLLQLPIGNYTCLSAQGQSVYMDYWDEEIQGSNSIYYELEYGNTVSIYKYLDGADAENDAICYKIRTFKEHVDVKTDLYRNEVKSIEVNELEHFYSIDHLDLTISEVEQIVRECHTNHKPLVIVKGKMRYLCNQIHLLGTGNQYLVFIFTNYDGNGLATVYRNQYLRDTTSSDRSILATAEQTPYTIQFTKGTSTDTPQ